MYQPKKIEENLKKNKFGLQAILIWRLVHIDYWTLKTEIKDICHNDI